MLAGWEHIRASKPALSSTKGNWRRSRQLDSIRTFLPILARTASDRRHADRVHHGVQPPPFGLGPRQAHRQREVLCSGASEPARRWDDEADTLTPASRLQAWP